MLQCSMQRCLHVLCVCVVVVVILFADFTTGLLRAFGNLLPRPAFSIMYIVTITLALIATMPTLKS